MRTPRHLSACDATERFRRIESDAVCKSQNGFCPATSDLLIRYAPLCDSCARQLLPHLDRESLHEEACTKKPATIFSNCCLPSTLRAVCLFRLTSTKCCPAECRTGYKKSSATNIAKFPRTI